MSGCGPKSVDMDTYDLYNKRVRRWRLSGTILNISAIFDTLELVRDIGPPIIESLQYSGQNCARQLPLALSRSNPLKQTREIVSSRL